LKKVETLQGITANNSVTKSPDRLFW